MAFDTNIATQTVEYQNLDRLVLKNGHVVLIVDESIDVWISEELMDDGHDCNYTLPFQREESDEELKDWTNPQ